MRSTRIRFWQLVAYGQIVAPLAVIGLPIVIYIPPFYSQALGLDLAAIGFILMGARLIDVLIDPLVGRLGALLERRRGRRSVRSPGTVPAPYGR
jgi:Na+/melibiose symporter-like transporter